MQNVVSIQEFGRRKALRFRERHGAKIDETIRYHLEGLSGCTDDFSVHLFSEAEAELRLHSWDHTHTRVNDLSEEMIEILAHRIHETLAREAKWFDVHSCPVDVIFERCQTMIKSLAYRSLNDAG